MANVSFLQPNIAKIRHQIQCILESYSHEWDLLSELVQNAVDAIKSTKTDLGAVSLRIDSRQRLIEIADNGVGIAPAEIESLLRPFGTNKRKRADLVGEKGVGLKYVIFSSSQFELSTRGKSGACNVAIHGASDWAKSDSDEDLLLVRGEDSDVETGTRVKVLVADHDHPIFKYTFEELVFILRTKTAVGDTGFIWGDAQNIDASLTHVDLGGAENTVAFKSKYLLPTEKVKEGDVLDLADFKTWMKVRDRSDHEKRKKLQDKVVYTKGRIPKQGREVRYWSCFVPKRDTWRRLSEFVGIKQEEPDPEMPVQEAPGVGFTGGFVTSTKGMPTGISIEMKPRGSGGYVPNFFILVEDPALSFDIGRKSIPGRQQGMLKEIAFSQFREYVNYALKYVRGDVDPEDSEWERDEAFSEILTKYPNLNSDKSRFVKRPYGQEATVAAMFYEQIGRDEFADVKPLASAYKDRYDLYALWKDRRCVIEFKYDLNGLFNDFADEKKMFDEIDVVVVWEVTEIDLLQAQKRIINVEPVAESALSKPKGFPLATKALYLGGVNPIYVVEMKRVLGVD